MPDLFRAREYSLTLAIPLLPWHRGQSLSQAHLLSVENLALPQKIFALLVFDNAPDHIWSGDEKRAHKFHVVQRIDLAHSV
jgi:hypothetical protein